MGTDSGENKNDSAKAVSKHENFLVQDEVRIRRKIIRQDRISVPSGKCYIILDQKKYEVVNISTFGLAAIFLSKDFIEMKSVLENSEPLELPLIFAETQTQILSLRPVRIEKHPQSIFEDKIVAFEVIGETLNVDRIKALEASIEVIELQKGFEKKLVEIPANFRLLVYEMKDWLIFLKTKIEELEAHSPIDSNKDNQEFRMTIAESISEYVGKIIPNQYRKIPEMLKGMDQVTVAAAIQFFRQQIGTLVLGAPFANRAFYKPRGYAGDYEMMNHLYRGELIGRTLFDQCMHKYFIEEPSGRAVKNRCDYMFDKIIETVKTCKSDTIRILAVASGPAVEQQLFLKNSKDFLNKKIEFVCLDQDEESLKHAQREIQMIERFANTGFSFRYVNLAIKNIIIEGPPEKDFDLVYSAGLFDYFTDPVAQSAALKLYESVRPGGRLIIGNFSKDNPNQTIMELLLDWYLIYRSEDELKQLFGVIKKDLTIEKEKLAINLFAVMKK
ncbi:MAG: class I SAM-dependent methyltransferase [Bdellovibrionota bacterium]